MLERSFALAQGDISSLQTAPKSGAVSVLAIHGWLDNAASFVPLMTATPELNWTAIDLPGHGFSFHRPPHSHYHFVDWVTDLVDFIELYSPAEKVHLVGHSLGGMLSTVLAGLYPEKVASAFVIDAAGLITQNSDSIVQDMRGALDSRIALRSKQKRLHSDIESAIRARMTAGSLSREAAQLLVNRSMKKVPEGYLWCSDQRLKTTSPLRMNQQAAEAVISNIEAPVRLCLADQGFDLMKEKFNLYKPFYADAELVTVPGGHHCHMEHPEQVGQELLKFYDQRL